MSEQGLVKPASLRQMAYIRRLCTELGECEIEVSEGISSSDASRIISELIAKAGKSGATNSRIKVDKLLKRFKGNTRLVKGRIR